jgi:outer membrane protein assembly factor BamB
VVIHDGVVLTADRRGPKAAGEQVSWTVSIGGGGTSGMLIAYSLADGSKLWEAPCHQNYNAPPDVFVIKSEVWTGRVRTTRDPGYTEIRALRTGEVTRTFPADPNRQVGMPHHRCYRNRATPRYVLAGRAGIEFVDVQDGSTVPHNWVRGACQFGVLPANGLIYAPPHSCACYPKAKLNGFNALAARRPDAPTGHDGRLEQGPAYGRPADGAIGPADWPVFRHDGARTGVASCALTAELKPAWTTDLSAGRLSPPVMAGGKLYVAGVENHTLHALDSSTGSIAWTYTTGGPIDSPPSITGGLAVFGSRDGYVYCLRTRDGALVWRFRAAPEDRRGVAFGQLESVYAVHGSVLVKGNEAIFASGLSSYMDGGIRIYRLDTKTGKQLGVTCINDWDPATGLHPGGRGFDIEGSLPDILSTDGTRLFMRHRVLDAEGKPQPAGAPHLFSPTGFLDSTWWHRTYWVYGPNFGSGWGGWHRVGGTVPSGRILVVAGDSVYGFGRSGYPGGNAGQWNRGEHYRFFAASTSPAQEKAPQPQPAKGKEGKKPQRGRSKVAYHWQKRLPLQCRAMVLAGDTLFVAGPADKDKDDVSGPKGPMALGTSGKLWALAARDGSKLTELPVNAAPVFDGLIAADGKLCIATLDGRVQCFSK